MGDSSLESQVELTGLIKNIKKKMTTRRAKKSSVRRNTKSFKKVDPFWEENPKKLESRNKRLRQIAIKSLVKKNAASENERLLKDQDKFFDNRTKYVQQEGESDRDFKQR